MDYSPEHIDYLSRSFLDRSNRLIQGDISDQDIYFPSKDSVRCLQILGVSRSWNELKPKRWDANSQPYRTSDILAGCFGAKIPILFSVQGFASTIRVCLGRICKL